MVCYPLWLRGQDKAQGVPHVVAVQDTAELHNQRNGLRSGEGRRMISKVAMWMCYIGGVLMFAGIMLLFMDM